MIPFFNHRCHAYGTPTMPQALGGGPLYSENFESYAVDHSLIGVGDKEWTSRYATPAFTVVAGKHGKLVDAGSVWTGISCNAAALAALANYVLDFDVKAAPSNRWIIGFRLGSAGGYWIQCVVGAQLRLFLSSDWTFLGGSLLLADWDANVPSVAAVHVKITVNGSNISLQVDSGPVNTHTNTVHSAGTIGMFGYDFTGWQIDNIVVL